MPEVNPQYAARFETLERTSAVEADYFCEHCGYNLHGQPVRRDPDSLVMLARCPECGAFHAAVGASSAARLWVDRLARSMLLSYLLLAYTVAFTVVALHFMLIEYALMRLKMYDAAHHAGERGFFVVLGVVCAISAALGLTANILSAVAFTHWKRWSYLLAAVLWAVITATLCLAWSNQREQMIWVTQNAIPYTLLFAGAFVVGGWIGAFLGRPLARLSVLAILPPGLRGRLDYLWTVDRLTPPDGAAEPRR
jgi:hypothetical protein